MSAFSRSWMAFAAFLTGAVMAAPVCAAGVPSGQSITLHEVLVDNVSGEEWLRFRFIAPAIAREGGEISFDQAGEDMAHLCQSVTLPYLDEFALSPDLIVISLADQETEFGAINPDATQFFEAFRVENETCIWEAF